MTLKRRRERDRPKCPPDAAYNPNKRVLLSYASDEDDGPAHDATETDPTTDERTIANYQIDEYPHAEGDDQPAMRTLDKIEPPHEAAEQEATEKEGREQEKPSKPFKNWGNNVKRNERTNQYPQLGLVSFQWDQEDEDEEYDSTTEEAMAYLRAVRDERQGLPEILAAAPRVQDYQDNGQSAGNGSEAVEASMPDYGVQITPSASPEDDASPQKAFTLNIKNRFLDQRRQLAVPPTAEALASLDDGYPISFPPGNNKAHAEWHCLLSSKAPRLAQLQSLEQETVYDLLELLQTRVLATGKNIERNVSNWIWSLLARLDEVGNMTNDQVYPLRELGKKAILLQYAVTNPEIATQLESVGQAGAGVHNEDEIRLNDDDEDYEPGQDIIASKPQTPAEPPQITDNTLATLDMILVVIGEIFGQRDLLEFRRPWTVAESQPP